MSSIPHTADDVERDARADRRRNRRRAVRAHPGGVARRARSTSRRARRGRAPHLGEIGALSPRRRTSGDGAALSFLGAGLTPHTIPSVVDALLSAASGTRATRRISRRSRRARCRRSSSSRRSSASSSGWTSPTRRCTTARRRPPSAAVAGATGEAPRGSLAGALHPQYEHTVDTYLAGSESGCHGETSSPSFGDDGRVGIEGARRATAAKPTSPASWCRRPTSSASSKSRGARGGAHARRRCWSSSTPTGGVRRARVAGRARRRHRRRRRASAWRPPDLRRTGRRPLRRQERLHAPAARPPRRRDGRQGRRAAATC